MTPKTLDEALALIEWLHRRDSERQRNALLAEMVRLPVEERFKQASIRVRGYEVQRSRKEAAHLRSLAPQTQNAEPAVVGTITPEKPSLLRRLFGDA